MFSFPLLLKKALAQGLFKTYALISFVILCIIMFVTTRDGGSERVYPSEEKDVSRFIGKIEVINSPYLSAMDGYRMKVYSLNNYYILSSILCGPSGRASNYHHYLLTNSDCSKQVHFMSLSSSINNIWLTGDTVFADILDFIDDEYDNEMYFRCESCDYVLYHIRVPTSNFSLDTISEEKISLKWEDLKCFSK